MDELKYLAITEISPNPYQPRLSFDSTQLEELAQSIKENGLIQPLIVRKSQIIGYELLAGERRLRASQMAQLERVPVIIKDLTDEEMIQQSIIENLQRADLNPIEEATSYKKLLERGMTHDQIARVMGKSRPYITNCIRLLQLSLPLQESIESNQISQGHARLLLTFSEEEQVFWLHKIQTEGLSVRALEKQLTKKKKKRLPKKNLFIKEEEKKLSQAFGTSVSIHQSKKGSGTIVISFSNPEEEERLIHTLIKKCE